VALDVHQHSLGDDSFVRREVRVLPSPAPALTLRSSWWWCLGIIRSIDEEIKELTDLDVAFEWMPKMGVRTQAISVAPPFSLMGKVSGLLELGNDPLCRRFGDADAIGDIAESNPGSFGNRDEDASVVGEKGP